MNAELQYLSIAQDILENGIYRPDRTGVGTYSLFGLSIRHSYSEGFPLLTTKKMFTKGIVGELLWFIQGNTNIKWLQHYGIRIWNEWADDNGDLGPVYGKQLVAWENKEGKIINQLDNIINSLQTNPYSRRHVMTFWNVGDLDKMALVPCHGICTQFYVHLDKDKENFKSNDGCIGDISISTIQRSCDWFLGVPYNIASYSFLLYMIGQITNLRPKEMYYTFNDAHIYSNHVKQMTLQISRKPYKLPKLLLNNKEFIYDYSFEDFKIEEYNFHPSIKGKVAV